MKTLYYLRASLPSRPSRPLPVHPRQATYDRRLHVLFAAPGDAPGAHEAPAPDLPDPAERLWLRGYRMEGDRVVRDEPE